MRPIFIDIVTTYYRELKTYVEKSLLQLSHFLTGTWAIVQANNSKIDFDYIG